jgi:hypothetical protein
MCSPGGWTELFGCAVQVIDLAAKFNRCNADNVKVKTVLGE